MESKRRITVFLDDLEIPFGVFEPPAKLVLDTTKIADGKHELKVKATSSKGIEGIKIIPFEVRNGPSITVLGLKPNEVIESSTAITINAYGNEATQRFIIKGSETPKAIPSYIWALLIIFIAFAVFYFITLWTMNSYKSFF